METQTEMHGPFEFRNGIWKYGYFGNPLEHWQSVSPLILPFYGESRVIPFYGESRVIDTVGFDPGLDTRYTKDTIMIKIPGSNLFWQIPLEWGQTLEKAANVNVIYQAGLKLFTERKLPHDNRAFRKELKQIHKLERQLADSGFNYRKNIGGPDFYMRQGNITYDWGAA